MSEPPEKYLTTKELAELLRIRERKIYDLAANGDVPCIRVVGKLLFPENEVLAWMAASRSGPVAAARIPNVIAGSHDPLLEWALRESGCGIAAIFDGSFDGLQRFSAGEVLACGLHVYERDGWNLNTVKTMVGDQPVVLISFATRKRGLIVAKGNPISFHGMGDLIGSRFGRRQKSAASHRLFEALAEAEGIDPTLITGPEMAARTEDDVALMVLENQADVALGLEAVAARLGLGFIPLLDERFDLLVWRRDYFEPPFQKLLTFLNSEAFGAKVDSLTGYDTRDLATPRFNGLR